MNLLKNKKEESERIIKEILSKSLVDCYTDLEWFDGPTQGDDVWCRFLTADLDPQTYLELSKYFTVYILSFDHSWEENSTLRPAFMQFLEEEGVSMFSVELSSK